MFMTPLMCVWFMKVKPREAAAEGQAADPYAGRFYRLYKVLLEGMLRARILVLAVTAAAFAGALYATNFVEEEFFPAGDRNQYLVYLDLPTGTRTEKTAEVALRLSNWLMDKSVNPEVASTIAYVGSGGPRFFLSLDPMDPDPHLAFLVVNTQESEQVDTMIWRTRASRGWNCGEAATPAGSSVTPEQVQCPSCRLAEVST